MWGNPKVLTGTQTCWHLELALPQPPELWEINTCGLSHLVYCMLLRQPKRTEITRAMVFVPVSHVKRPFKHGLGNWMEHKICSRVPSPPSKELHAWGSWVCSRGVSLQAQSPSAIGLKQVWDGRRGMGARGFCPIHHINGQNVGERCLHGAFSSTPQLCSQQHKIWLSKDFWKRLFFFSRIPHTRVALLLLWSNRKINYGFWHSWASYHCAPCPHLPEFPQLKREREETPRCTLWALNTSKPISGAWHMAADSRGASLHPKQYMIKGTLKEKEINAWI